VRENKCVALQTKILPVKPPLLWITMSTWLKSGPGSYIYVYTLWYYIRLSIRCLTFCLILFTLLTLFIYDQKWRFGDLRKCKRKQFNVMSFRFLGPFSVVHKAPAVYKYIFTCIGILTKQYVCVGFACTYFIITLIRIFIILMCVCVC